MRTHLLIGTSTLTLLAACAVGPRFQPPHPDVPTQWDGGALEPTAALPSRIAAEALDAQWWQSFADPLLSELVATARTANPDLEMATLRVAQSRRQREAVLGGRLPSVTASASYQRQRQSEHGTSTRLIDAIGAPGADRDAIIEVLSEPFDVYQAGFDAAWELDLWGRVRRSIESATASLAASTEDLHDAQLSVTAETARTYFDLRGVQDQLRIAREEIASNEDSLTLVEYRAAGGIVSELDVITRRAQLADARARIPQLEQRERQLTNALALLLGQAPGSLADKLATRTTVQPPARVAVGMPSEIARRRPDIRRAEARLHAATAEIGVAVADLYPRISLTGGFLSQSLDASDFTDWGSRQWSVGPSLQLPLFDGGRRRAVIELRELQQQEAAVNYQRTVLRAWHEIDAMLSAYAAEQRRHQELAIAVSASKDAFDIAQLRYERGLTSNLVALDAQRTWLQAQRAYSDSSTTIATQLVALYKSLGGGWEESSLPATAATPR